MRAGDQHWAGFVWGKVLLQAIEGEAGAGNIAGLGAPAGGGFIAAVGEVDEGDDGCVV